LAGITVDEVPGTSSFDLTLGIETLYDGGNLIDFVRLGTATVLDGTFPLSITDDAVSAQFIHVDAAALRLTDPIPEPSVSLLGLLGFGFLLLRRG